MVQEQDNIQVQVEGDLNEVGIDEAAAEEIGKRIAYTMFIQMTISGDQETRVKGFNELYRMARCDYVPAIASVGYLYILRGKDGQNENFSLLGRRLCEQASNLGSEDAKGYLEKHPELADIEDDGRHLDYPNPGGPPMPVKVDFSKIAFPPDDENQYAGEPV